MKRYKPLNKGGRGPSTRPAPKPKPDQKTVAVPYAALGREPLPAQVTMPRAPWE